MSTTNGKENIEDSTKILINSKSKRPAQTLYIPKHMRNEENTTIMHEQTLVVSPSRYDNQIMSDPSIIGYITDCSKNAEATTSSEDTDGDYLILNKLETLNISEPFSHNEVKATINPIGDSSSKTGKNKNLICTCKNRYVNLTR